jgi:hypothetical protein
MLSACCAVLAAESVTLTVKEDVPDADGVPEIAPELALNKRPVGSAPVLRLQL